MAASTSGKPLSIDNLGGLHHPKMGIWVSVDVLEG